MCWTDDIAFYSEDEYLSIADCTVKFIDANFDSSFMWTAHNELRELKWDYMAAYDAGWFRELDKYKTKSKSGKA